MRSTAKSKRVRSVGWEFAHVCVDSYTRLSYAEMLPNERAETAADISGGRLAWYRARDIVIERIMTDDGNAYRSHRFADVCRERGVRHLFAKPYTPKTAEKPTVSSRR